MADYLWLYKNVMGVLYMHNGYSMNLAWPTEQYRSKEEYQTWLALCEKYNINCVRIILAPWGLNPVETSTDLSLLCDVIRLAQYYSIEVILVVDTYVNYVRHSYRDFADSEFGWYTNRFSSIHTLDSFLSKTGKTQYISDISGVLREVTRYSNVNIVELCNEMDQIESRRDTIIQWINNSIEILSHEYEKRFEYRVSISDYRKYSYFAKRLNCKCDIHSYRFPYNTALENYTYLKNRFPQAWLSEFACFSDYAYAESIESRIYFYAMMLCAAFENCRDFPAPWWWEKIMPDPAYMSVYKFLDNIQDEFVSRKTEYFLINEIEQIHRVDSKITNKIRYRLSVLIKNPKYIIQEIPAITKFLRKRICSKYNHPYAILGYESAHGDQYFILETYVPIKICYKNEDGRLGSLVCKDMTRGQQVITVKINEDVILCEGTYWLIIQNDEQN